MSFLSRLTGCRSRRFVLLAPEADDNHVAAFASASDDSHEHGRLLRQAQRLRGEVYVNDGFLDPACLTSDGRHVQTADHSSWHLLTVDEDSQVQACMRYTPFDPMRPASHLHVADSPLADDEQWAPLLNSALENELFAARHRRFSYVEIGGWAVAEELRRSTEATRMVLAIYALGQLFGGALGVTTANCANCSSSVLKRLGGRRLSAEGVELPCYYDPRYRADIELVCFDSAMPDAKYTSVVHELRTVLSATTVIRNTAKEYPGFLPLGDFATGLPIAAVA